MPFLSEITMQVAGKLAILLPKLLGLNRATAFANPQKSDPMPIAFDRRLGGGVCHLLTACVNR